MALKVYGVFLVLMGLLALPTVACTVASFLEDPESLFGPGAAGLSLAQAIWMQGHRMFLHLVSGVLLLALSSFISRLLIRKDRALGPPGSGQWHSALLDVTFRVLGVVATLWVIRDSRAILPRLRGLPRGPLLEVCVVEAVAYLLSGAGLLRWLALRDVLSDGEALCNGTGDER